MICIQNNMTSQEEKLSVMMSDWCLFNVVTESTRLENLLDLALVNDRDLIKEVAHVVNEKITDHDLIVMNLNIDVINSDSEMESIDYRTKIPRYGWRNGDSKQWECYQASLNSNNWSEIPHGKSMDEKLDILYDCMEEAIKDNFEDINEKKKLNIRLLLLGNVVL